MQTHKGVLISTLKMGLATLSSRILGLIRELALAMTFGASGITDAYYVAFRIPNLLRDLFAEGAFSAAFVPTFTEVHAIDPKQARKNLWSLFCLMGLITGVLSLLTCIFAPEILSLFAPAFKQDQKKFELTVMLIRLMSPFLVFISIAALFMGVLNTLKIFFLPSFAPALFNVCMISAIFFLPKVMDSYGLPAALALGFGVLIGGFVQMLVQFIPLVKLGYGPCGFNGLITDFSRKILKLISVGLIGFSATQVNLIVTTILATGTVVGAVSWLSYAFRLFQFPVGILSVSVSGSNLVHFSGAWKTGRKEEAVEILKGSYYLSFFLVLPVMALMFAIAEPSVALVFERGKFIASDSFNTALLVRLYLIGLPFYSLYKIVGPVFYALDKQNIPVTTSVICVLLNVIFCVSLVPSYSYPVLALGTTLSIFLNSTILSVLLKRELKLGLSFFFSTKLLKVFVASVLLFFFTNHLVAQSQDAVRIKLELINFIGVCAVSVFAYVIMLFAFGLGKDLKSIFQRKSQ